MTSTGFNVMGWGVNEKGDIKQDTVQALRIMSPANMTYDPEATSKGYVSGILDKNDKDVSSANGKTVNLNFYDNLGYSYTARFTFKQSADPKDYSLELTALLDANGNQLEIPEGTELFGNERTQEKPTKVSFDNQSYSWDKNKLTLTSYDGSKVYADLNAMMNGDQLKGLSEEIKVGDETMTVETALNNIAKAYGYEGSTEEFLNLYQNSAADPTQKVIIEQMMANAVKKNNTDSFTSLMFTTADNETEVEMDGRIYTGSSISFNPDNGKFNGIGGVATQNTATLNLSNLGKNFKDIEIDFSQSSMMDNKGTSTIGATSGDLEGRDTGRRLGDLIGVSIQDNGMIYASYDNGQTKLLGQIATAEFANASGLEKQGDNLYSATLNSGEFDGIGVDVSANGGYMSTGQLEMSNVDLSAEFTEMITTQRGFQANSRIITVSDTMLEELTNLKR